MDKDTPSSHKVFFPNLDGLRFIAFFLVFLTHGFAIPAITDNSHGFLVTRLKNAVFSSGWAGVSFFFVLSGFLITYLILKEIDVTGRIDVKAFYVRRILRIWPLYYVVILFAFVAYPLLKANAGFPPGIQAGNPLYYVFFLSNFDVIQLGQGHGAMSTNITWSVAIEEQFYLAWPLLFFFVPRSAYKFLFPAIILMSAVFRFYHFDDEMVVYFHSLSVISDMAVGGLAAYLTLKSERFSETIARIPMKLLIVIYIAGLILIVFRPDIFVGSVLGALERLFISLFFVFVVLEQNYCRHSIFKMSKLKRISRLGVYTYGLYLLHPIAITFLLNVATLLALRLTTWLAIGLGLGSLLLSILMAATSYHFFEKKFLNLKSRFTPMRERADSYAMKNPPEVIGFSCTNRV